MFVNRPIALAACVLVPFLIACEQRTTPKTTPPNPTPPVGGKDQTRPAPAPDNTANNKGDAAASAKTPMDQSQAGDDVAITAKVRRAIMEDKSMSTNAQNCKIITDKFGVVTLRGVVNSQAERDSIDAKARAIAGVTRVDNQLEVKTN